MEKFENLQKICELERNNFIQYEYMIVKGWEWKWPKASHILFSFMEILVRESRRRDCFGHLHSQPFIFDYSFLRCGRYCRLQKLPKFGHELDLQIVLIWAALKDFYHIKSFISSVFSLYKNGRSCTIFKIA